MGDVSQQMALVEGTQQEASKVIDYSNASDFHPHFVAESMDIVAPTVDSKQRPTEVSPGVENYISKSRQHASTLQDKDDADLMSWTDRYVDHFKNQAWDIPSAQRESNQIAIDFMHRPESVDEAKYLRWVELQEDLKKAQEDETRNGFTGDFESLPAKVVGMGIDMVKGVAIDEWDTVAKFAASGAAAGAAAGAAIAMPTGVGVPAAAIGGARTGLSMGLRAGTAAAFLSYAYHQSAGALYTDLTFGKDENGEPYKIDDVDKRYLAMGLGAVSASVDGALSLTIAKTVPQLSRFFKPRVSKVLAGSGAYRQALVNIGKAAALGGTSNTIQEVVQMLGEDLGKTATISEDGKQSELSVENAIINFSNNIDYERLKTAAITGTATAGTFSAAGNIIGFKTLKEQIDSQNAEFEKRNSAPPPSEPPSTPQVQPEIPVALRPDPELNGTTPEQRVLRAGRFKQMLDTITTVGKSTKLYGIARDRVNEVHSEILKNAGITQAYLDVQEARKKATNPEKAKVIRDLIDPKGETLSEINVDPQVDPIRALKVIEDHPEMSGIFKLEPEDPSGDSAIAFMKEKERAQKAQQEFFDKQGVEPRTLEEVATKDQAIGEKNPVLSPFYDEQTYIKRPVFTEIVSELIPESEKNKIFAAQEDVRQRVADSVAESAKLEMDKIVDINVDEAISTEQSFQLERLKDNPNVKVVEMFLRGGVGEYAGFEHSRPWDEAARSEELIAPHHKEGFSPIAMDPRLVPENLRPYLESEQMKKNKAFVKGGVSPDEAARMAGVNSVERLFQILSTTDGVEESAKRASEAQRERLREKFNESVNFNETAISKIYSDQAALHLQELKLMKDEKWSAMKTGIKRIALPLKSHAELRSRADREVGTSKIRDLKASQYVMGERRSQKLAVDAILKNEVEKAFIAKEAAALNSELIRASKVAIGEVNRAVKYFKRFYTNEYSTKFKEAGGTAESVKNMMLDIFQLKGKLGDEKGKEHFDDLAKEMIEKGWGDIGLPVKMLPPSFWEGKLHWKDMTVDQLRAVERTMRMVDNYASKKNELALKHKKADIVQTVEAFAAKTETLKSHPEFDSSKLVSGQGDVSFYEHAFEKVRAIESSVTNMRHQLTRLDGKVNGFLTQYVFNPLAGIGEFKGQGIDGVKRDFEVLKNFMKEGIDKFGKKRFEDMGITAVDVPEVRGNPFLRDGKMVMSDIFMIAVNLGNEGNVDAITKYGITKEKAFEIVGKYLTKDHLDFIQDRIWGSFEQYRDRIADLEKRTVGIRPDMVEGTPFEMFGQTYRGGYFPIFRASDGDAGIKGLNSKINPNEHFEDKSYHYTFAMTKQGHLISRTGSEIPLSLNINNIAKAFDQHITDLNLREPVRDVQNLLSHEKVKENFVGVIGHYNFKMMVDTVKDAAASMSKRDEELFKGQSKVLNGMVDFISSSASNAYLVANIGSIAIQPVSIFYSFEKMGGSSSVRHISDVLKMMVSNVDKVKEMTRIAEEINPILRDAREHIDDTSSLAISKLLPQKSDYFEAKTSKKLKVLWSTQEFVNEKGYEALGYIDNIQKMVVTLAAYKQFIEGEAPGWKREEVALMSQEQRHAAASGYASHISGLTLTTGGVLDRAPIQKGQLGRIFVKFWNDLRNTLNNRIATARNIKGAIRDERYVDASKIALTGLITSALAKVYESRVRGDDDDVLKGLNVAKTEDAVELARRITVAGFKSPLYFAGDFVKGGPISRDIWYGATRKIKGDLRPVSIPILSAATDVATAMSSVPVLINGSLSFVQNMDMTPAIVSNYLEQMRILETSDTLSNTQLRSVLRAGSYFVKGGAPVNAALKYYQSLTKEEEPEIQDNRESLIDTFKKHSEKILKMDDIPQSYKDEIIYIRDQISPEKKTVEQLYDSSVFPVIAQIESNGDWTKFNPNSSAAGKYQFTEGTWREIMDKAPQLGLTESGRVASNPAQQDAAMKWYTERNVEALAKKNLPIGTESIYTLHFLGEEKGIKVLSANEQEPLKNILDKKVMEANGFNGKMTVGEFKKWVDQTVADGEDRFMRSSEVQ